MTPARRRLVVEADGGSRGNPGPAGYGALVREDDRVVAERAEAIGRATNNVAEYRGLLAGLTAAADICPDAEVEVRMDSKLVVEQMSGRWQVKHPDLRPLATAAARLASRFPRVTYRWVPRAQNADADRLANQAMDEAAALGSGPTTASSSAEQPARAPSVGGGWGRPSGEPTVSLLVRHGATVLSAERRFSGVRSDLPLSPDGVDQVHRLAPLLPPVDVVVTSPLQRARQTAALLAPDAEQVVDERLRETDFGDWDGLTFAEVQKRWPDALTDWLADPLVAPPGGESFRAVELRVSAALDELPTRFARQRVLVTAHVTPIKLAVCRALQAPISALFRLQLDPASLTVVDWYPDGPAVVRTMNLTGISATSPARQGTLRP